MSYQQEEGQLLTKYPSLRTFHQDPSSLSKPLSQYQRKLQITRTQFSCITLQSRVRILEANKKKKIRDLENLLENHRRAVKTRLGHHLHQKTIEKRSEQVQKSMRKSCGSLQALRSSQIQSLSDSRTRLLNNNQAQFQRQRSEVSQIHIKVKQERQRILLDKVSKRNKIRNMELQNQNKVTHYWDTRVQCIKDRRMKEFSQKLQKHNKTQIKMHKLSGNASGLVSDIERIRIKKEEVLERMGKERKMKGNELVVVYRDEFRRRNARGIRA